MTLILIEKGLVLEGSAPKIEDKQVPDRSYGYSWWDRILSNPAFCVTKSHVVSMLVDSAIDESTITFRDMLGNMVSMYLLNDGNMWGSHHNWREHSTTLSTAESFKP